jgi:hypothetical protein
MRRYQKVEEIIEEWADPDQGQVLQEAAARIMEELREGIKLPQQPFQRRSEEGQQHARRQQQPQDWGKHLSEEEVRQQAKVKGQGAAAAVTFSTLVRSTYVILHLYSGRRRNGDLQHFVEWQALSEYYEVVVLSIDLAVDAKWGDLKRRETVDYWLQQVYSKRVVGSIKGPPCESWSAARLLEMDDKSNAPPPLRSRAKPWGLDGLKGKYYGQLHVANGLMFVALEFFAALLATRGCAILEHPAEPVWDHASAASIWRIAYIGWLRVSRAVELLTFNQRAHRQRGLKPTSLLTLRLPTLSKYIHTRQLPEKYQLDKQTDAPLRGKDSQGVWRTSAAKEYPQSMCVALAKGFYDTSRVHYWTGISSDGEEEDEEEEFQQHLQSYLAFVARHDRYQEEQADMCIDYNPCVQSEK